MGVSVRAPADSHLRRISLWCGKETEGGQHGSRRPVGKVLESFKYEMMVVWLGKHGSQGKYRFRHFGLS